MTHFIVKLDVKA